MTIKLWDIEAGKEKLTVKGLEEMVQSAAFSYNGSLYATSSKDRKLKIFDPRSGAVSAETEGHSGAKATLIAWQGHKDKLISVGFGKSSERELGIWDIRNFTKALKIQGIDTGAGSYQPIFDPDNSVLYLAAKGDTSIKFYEIVDEDPYAHYLNSHTASVPQTGVAILPKTIYDVKKCEVLRVLKLGINNSVEPISFKVPRTRTEFFQDDIYPLTRSARPVLSATEWFSGQTRDPDLISIKPSDMVALSEAPEADKKPKKFEPVKTQEVKETTTDDISGSVFGLVTNQFKENKSTKEWQTGGGVDEKEWDD